MANVARNGFNVARDLAAMHITRHGLNRETSLHFTSPDWVDRLTTFRAMLMVLQASIESESTLPLTSIRMAFASGDTSLPSMKTRLPEIVIFRPVGIDLPLMMTVARRQIKRLEVTSNAI